MEVEGHSTNRTWKTRPQTILSAMDCNFCRSRWASFAIFVTGSILIILGCSVKWGIFPNVLNDQIDENMKLSEDNTDTWDAFVEPPIPVYMNFHFLHVENRLDVKDGAKPNLTQYGPYAYREIRRKENLTHGGANSLYYNNYYSYTFDQEKSTELNCYNGKNEPCSDQDIIYVLNPIISMIGPLIPELSDTICDLLPSILDGGKIESLCKIALMGLEKKMAEDINVELNDPQREEDDLIFKTTVDGILYSGTETWLLKTYLYETLPELIATKLDPFFPNKNITENLPVMIQDAIDNKLPQLSDGMFGVFKGRNDTSENSFYRINDGENDQSLYLSTIEYNGQTSLPQRWWPDIAPTPSGNELGIKGICHDIKGTDGTQFPPGIEKDKRLWMFVSDLCRSIWVDYETEVEVQGVKAYRFRPPKAVYDMSSGANFCYCPTFLECACPGNFTADGQCKMDNPEDEEWDHEKCKQSPHDCYDGLIHVGACQGGAPIIMSAPFFYNGDPELGGMELFDPPLIDRQSKDLHDTILDLEPITAIVVNAHKRIQINMPLKKNTHKRNKIDILDKVLNIPAFPLVWADENAELDKETADMLKNEVLKPINLVDGFSYFMLALGCVLVPLSWAMALFCKAKYTNA